MLVRCVGLDQIVTTITFKWFCGTLNEESVPNFIALHTQKQFRVKYNSVCTFLAKLSLIEFELD